MNVLFWCLSQRLAGAPAGAAVLLGAVLGASLAHASDPDLKNDVYGGHYGYTFDVVAERNRRDIEMVMLDPPAEPKAPAKEPLVNDKLTKEFQKEYAYRFGQTAAEQIINSPGRSDDYTYYSTKNDVGIQEYTSYQRQFGAYMGRRLFEYHFDNWAKTSPTARPIVRAKDRFSNLDLKVKSGYKVKWKYNLSGPNMEVTFENPYKILAKIHADLNGLISPNEIIYSLGFEISPRLKVEALYKEFDGLYQLVFTRKINAHVATTLSGSIDTLPAGPIQQQNLFLVGFSWTE